MRPGVATLLQTPCRYAGIGARVTTQEVLLLMQRISAFLDGNGFTVRSGGADGADRAFAGRAKNRELYLPKPGFNGIDHSWVAGVVLTRPTNLAMQIAEKHHPNWLKVRMAYRPLHGRNTHVILGRDCNEPVKFVLCWTENGEAIGGTGQGIRVAEAYNVPVFNLQRDADREAWEAIL